MATQITTDAEPEAETDAEPEVETEAEPEAEPESYLFRPLTDEEFELYMELKKQGRLLNEDNGETVLERFKERVAHPGDNFATIKATIKAAYHEFNKEMDLWSRNNMLKVRELSLMGDRFVMMASQPVGTKRPSPPSPPSAGPSAGA